MPEIKWNLEWKSSIVGACRIWRLSNRENQWRIQGFPEGTVTPKVAVGMKSYYSVSFFPNTAWKWKQWDRERGVPGTPLDPPIKTSEILVMSTLVPLLSIFRLLFLSPLFVISKKIFTRILKYGGTLSLLGLPTLFCLKFFGFKIGCETRLNPSRVFRLQTALKETIWFNSPKSSHLNGIYFNQTVWSLIQESILVGYVPPSLVTTT